MKWNVFHSTHDAEHPSFCCDGRGWIQVDFQPKLRRFSVAVALIGFCISGCDTNPFPQVKVDGRITYEDGTVIPAERIRIWFQSQAPAIDATTHPRPASASVNCEDGTFAAATTRKYQDGLVRGEHRVYIDITPAASIPQEYTKSASSPLTISTDDAPLHIKIPKP